jgi:hypothetical protein
MPPHDEPGFYRKDLQITPEVGGCRRALADRPPIATNLGAFGEPPPFRCEQGLAASSRRYRKWAANVIELASTA